MRVIVYNQVTVSKGGFGMLFRKKIQKSCDTCLYGTNFADHQILCVKCGVVADSYACRKYRYDPCKRIPPAIKAPDFLKYKDEDFTLD